MAITISIPRLVLVFLLTATFLGLANARINTQSAAIRKTYNKGFSFETIDCSALNPFTLGIVKVAAFFLRTKTYHKITNGIMVNNQKNSGL